MRVGIVIIGRNEGVRLLPSLTSSMVEGIPVVYVDSGSNDNSVEMAMEMGCLVHELSSDRPFSAARARNEGLRELRQAHHHLELVQFLDGDSSLTEGWISEASKYLDRDPTLCSVFGAIRERHPEQSIFNRLTAVEWHAAAGEATAFGGICLSRIDPIQTAGGFDEQLVAGEESELSARLRNEGWRILSLDRLMAIHDAGMAGFSQWFRRCVRTGFVYAQAARKTAETDTRYGLLPSLRIWTWGFVVPLTLLAGLFYSPLVALLVVILYLLQTIKVSASSVRTGNLSIWHATLYGLFWHISIFGQWRGQCRYYWNRLRRASPVVRCAEADATVSIFDKKPKAPQGQAIPNREKR